MDRASRNPRPSEPPSGRERSSGCWRCLRRAGTEIDMLALLRRSSSIACRTHARLDPLITARLTTAQVALGAEECDLDPFSTALQTRRVKSFSFFVAHVHLC